MNEENHCAECGQTDVRPHYMFPALSDGACLCEDCGEEYLEEQEDAA